MPVTSRLLAGAAVPMPTLLVRVLRKTLVPLICQPETFRSLPDAEIVTVLSLVVVVKAIPAPAVKVRVPLEVAETKEVWPVTAMVFQPTWVLVMVGVWPGLISMPVPAFRE